MSSKNLSQPKLDRLRKWMKRQGKGPRDVTQRDLVNVIGVVQRARQERYFEEIKNDPDPNSGGNPTPLGAAAAASTTPDSKKVVVDQANFFYPVTIEKEDITPPGSPKIARLRMPNGVVYRIHLLADSQLPVYGFIPGEPQPKV